MATAKSFTPTVALEPSANPTLVRGRLFPAWGFWRPTVLRITLQEVHSGRATFEGDGRLKPVKTVQTSWGRTLATDTSGGRRVNFDEDAASRMMGKLENFCLQDMATFGHLPNGQKIENYVMDTLLPAEGVSSSYRIARERIVAPVLRKLKPPRRKNKL